MKQLFHHYKFWEDYHAGMYATVNAIEGHQLISRSIEILGEQDNCFYAMFSVITEWPIACEVNLTNTGMNRRAWLGQAACCITFQVPEAFTKVAWGELTDEQRDTANLIAEQVINFWELRHAEKIS